MKSEEPSEASETPETSETEEPEAESTEPVETEPAKSEEPSEPETTEGEKPSESASAEKSEEPSESAEPTESATASEKPEQETSEPKPAESEAPSEEPAEPEKPSETAESGKEEKEEAKPEPAQPSEQGKNEAPTSAKPQPSEAPAQPAPAKPEATKPAPKITTDAAIEDNGALVAGATVVDTVSFTGLEAGKKYTLDAELMCKASGASAGATAKMTFVPQVADGQVNVPVAVTDGDCTEQVAFETLRDSSGAVVATHHDLNDEAQTVTARDVVDKPAPFQEAAEKKQDKNITVVTENAPEVGKAVAPNTPRRSIKAIPSGSLTWEEGMPSHI
ncbi:VaFE repeat-containing surface-anchored protein [Corynebacterium lowii]|uniref:T-Q ester bond containing domain-containing protein n=1 Tax=Corynebacterium lowii TaxID=1544413 RepID=A0A0Q0Z8T2_9CORY|nr:VaFE repeat-containing surface-anchored protein [Corynebacterium lowii]KQB86003.1 hypothetical protein Clow_01745 [Corynebacterium lowii]MDP9850567.1 hypothetical protein [Corynebacterium lowii]